MTPAVELIDLLPTVIGVKVFGLTDLVEDF